MWGKPSRRQVLSAIGATLGWATVSGRVRGQQSPDGVVYAASETGELVAFSAATGERQWGFEFPNNSEMKAQKGGLPLVWNGTVYLSAQRQLHAVDAATGEREWVFEGEHGATWPPTVHGGTVYVVNNRGVLTALREEGDLETRGKFQMYALNAETGERKWRTDSPMLSGYCQAPLVYDGTVFVLGSHWEGGMMSAYDTETGAQRWGQVSSYGDLPFRFPRYGPVEVDGIIYIMGAQGGILGFDPNTGEHISRGGTKGKLGDTPYAHSRGKLSAFGSTLLSANEDRLDRFMPERDGEGRAPGNRRGGYFSFDHVGELGGVNSSFVRSSFAVGRPTATRHPYLVVGAQQWERGADAKPEGDAQFQATSMNPAIPAPDPEWTYAQPTLVNPTVAGRTAFIGGAELTALDLRDGTERWSSDDIAGRIVTAPTVTPDPEVGHSIDERIRHQTLNHHDELGSRPANFRVGAGRLSAAGLGVGDEYWFPDEAIEPREQLDSEARYVGQVDAAGRIVVPRNAIADFQTEHGTTPGLMIHLHNTGGVTTEKPVEVRVGETTLDTTVHIQGYGFGFLLLFEDLAAAPGYAESGLETDSARTYLTGSSLVEFSREQLLTGNSSELTVSTPDHERTIRFEGAASGDTPEQTDSPEGTESSTERTEPVDGAGQDTTGASGPGFGVVTGLTAIAAGGLARYVLRKQNDEE